MILKDMNQSWKQPEGYTFRGVSTKGAYLLVKFTRRQDTPSVLNEHWVVVYVNDMGREVMRTEGLNSWSAPQEEVAPAPVGRWFRIKNGFLIILQGIEEMIRHE